MTRFNYFDNGNKYKNTKIEYDGYTFDSKKEYRRYLMLRFRQDAGEISNLEIQVPYLLIPAQYEETDEVYKKGPKAGQKKQGKCIEKEVKYIADFRYIENGEVVVEDAKSPVTRTPQYILKRKLMLYIHGVRVREV